MHRITRLCVAGATWAKQHRKMLVGGFCVFAVVALAIVLPMHVAFADDIDAAATGEGPIAYFLNVIATLFNGIANTIGSLVLSLIGIILIPILNYNGFATSPIVGLGWSLVRDVVNMFVVVVLLVIAVLTIVGSPKVNWQQQIPRIFIYVVVVNFSRTICGFLIDIGNVIMFQFVNALVEIGAGNFSQLLKLDIAGDYSGSITGANAWQNLGAAYLQVALMTMILAVVGIIAIVFIYRIVILWVLIIMSPAAFFLGGIKDIFAQAGSAYSQWWKKFSSAIVIGPILSFFLWLALAASAKGDIAATETFPMGETENFGLLLKVFDMSQLTGLLLGVVLLVVGLQQAASSAGALGGIAAKLVSEDMGFKIAKAGLKWPSTFGKGGYAAANYIAPETTQAATAFAAKKGGDVLSYAGSAISDVPVVSSLGGGYLGRKISEQGNKLYAAGSNIDEEQMKKARESLKHVPKRYKDELYKSMEDGSGTFSGMSKWQKDAMYEDMATKVGTQKDALAAFTPRGATADDKLRAQGKRDSLLRKVITKTQKDLDGGHSDLDDTQKKDFKGTKSQYIDITFEALGDTKAGEFVEELDSGFEPSMVRDRALNGQRGVENLTKVRAALNKRVVQVTAKGDRITALHEREMGKHGSAKSDQAGVGIATIAAENVERVRRGRGEAPLPVYVNPGTPAAPRFGVDGLDPRDSRNPNNRRNSSPGGGGRGGGTPPPVVPPPVTPTPPAGTPPVPPVPPSGGGGPGGTGGGRPGGGGTGGSGGGTGGAGAGTRVFRRVRRGGGGGTTTSTGTGPTASSGGTGHGPASSVGSGPTSVSGGTGYGSGAAPTRRTRPIPTPVVVEDDDVGTSHPDGLVPNVSDTAHPDGLVPEREDAYPDGLVPEDSQPRSVQPLAGADEALERVRATSNANAWVNDDGPAVNNSDNLSDEKAA